MAGSKRRSAWNGLILSGLKRDPAARYAARHYKVLQRDSQTPNVCPELRELVVTDLFEIDAQLMQYIGVPAPFVVDRAELGIVLIVSL